METTFEPAVLEPGVLEPGVLEPAVLEPAVFEEPAVIEPAVVISKNDTVTVNVALGSAAYYALEEVQMQMKTKVISLPGVVHN